MSVSQLIIILRTKNQAIPQKTENGQFGRGGKIFDEGNQQFDPQQQQQQVVQFGGRPTTGQIPESGFSKHFRHLKFVCLSPV